MSKEIKSEREAYDAYCNIYDSYIKVIMDLQKICDTYDGTDEWKAGYLKSLLGLLEVTKASIIVVDAAERIKYDDPEIGRLFSDKTHEFKMAIVRVYDELEKVMN